MLNWVLFQKNQGESSDGYFRCVLFSFYEVSFIHIHHSIITGNSFWTMTPAGGYSPYGSTGWLVAIFFVNVSGSIDDPGMNTSRSLRPVINIRSDVTVSGLGTMESPYTIS